MIPLTWPVKDPAEAVNLGFDFAAEIAAGESITGAPVVAAALVAGTDPTPLAILSGSPSVAGFLVLQRVVGGVDGATYHVRCQITLDSGRILVLAATLPVRAA